MGKCDYEIKGTVERVKMVEQIRHFKRKSLSGRTKNRYRRGFHGRNRPSVLWLDSGVGRRSLSVWSDLERILRKISLVQRICDILL